MNSVQMSSTMNLNPQFNVNFLNHQNNYSSSKKLDNIPNMQDPQTKLSISKYIYDQSIQKSYRNSKSRLEVT